MLIMQVLSAQWPLKSGLFSLHLISHIWTRLSFVTFAQQLPLVLPGLYGCRAEGLFIIISGARG